MESPDLSPKSALTPSSQKAMVLLVDDQLIVAEAMRIILQDQPDLELHYAQDSRDAVETARRVKPTVILQDLVMPGSNGLDLVREYRADAQTANIPIIVLSAKDEASIKSDAFLAGANDYLVKIPEPVELIARLRYHSGAYLAQLQRDEAYRALRRSQQELIGINLELQRLTKIDGLTSLSNRRYLDEALDAEWKHCIRTRTPISALMIDIDHFKLFNDAYGHIAGDEALQNVARILGAACRRSSDIAGRYGGEEFCLILPGMEEKHAIALAESLIAQVSDLAIPHKSSPTKDCVTISVGVATCMPTREQAPANLIKSADEALYIAKRNGRNGFRICE